MMKIAAVILAMLSSAAMAQQTYRSGLMIRGHLPEWIEFEADNGATVSIDAKSVKPNVVNGWRFVDVIILTSDETLMELSFNCSGHYQDIGNLNMYVRSRSNYIAPRSVAAAIEKKVCQQ